MGKKGQFTILVLFGLIAIIAIGIVLFIRSEFAKEIAEISTEEALKDFVNSEEVKSYVESCLQAVTEEAVKIIALQGGALWNHQGGPVEMDSQDLSDPGNPVVISRLGRAYLPRPEDGKIVNISYVLHENSRARCVAIKNSSEPPDYPYPGASLEDLNDLSFFREKCPAERDAGFFGTRKIPLLCLIGGPNLRGDPTSPVYRTCEGIYGRKRNNPVQFQLANYTEANLGKCINFSSLEQQQGFNVEIAENPAVEFLFGRDDITVSATYPVVISPEGRSPVTSHLVFYHRIDARIKEIYEYYRDLLLHEIRNISFDPGRDYANSRFYKPGFQVTYIKDACPGCTSWVPSVHDDLLIVRDQQTRVAGKYLTIQGILKNRAPVLNATEKQMQVPFTNIVNNELSGFFDVVAFNNFENSAGILEPVTLKLSPFALDPENDTISYSYSGWNSDYFDVQPAGCRPKLVAAIEFAVDPPASATTDELQGKIIEMIDACNETQKFPAPSNEWEGSQEYIDTGRDAAVEIPLSDYGIHEVKVTARDSLLMDYETVKILVIPRDVFENS